ncbi:hypothetical protein [Chitinilyticum piscinae]|uniref:Solute-binding protein family 3/N-terminal domain-containing protein n=1 Tax=Chitinilyticum piscinae TaxID=2866724 RepID=A0A8J7FWB1_9NEIS|nr:hypothetical protein [Chitinilyticum piscinae]MBE9608090.1 hypothetical protein [Chitinilyticum piscinae]
MALTRLLSMLLPLFAATGTAAAACSVDAAYPAVQVQGLLTPQPQRQLVSLHQRLGELSGCTIRIVDYPLARLWHTYELGDLPLVIGAIRAPDRDAHGQFYPMLQVQVVLIGRASSPAMTSAGLLASPTARLGVQRGSRSTPAGEKLRAAMESKGQLDYSVDSVQLLRKLQLDRTQAVLSYSILFAMFTADRLTDGLKAQPAPELGTAEAGIYLNASKLDARDAEALRRGMQQLQQEHYLARVLQGKLDRALIVPLPATQPAHKPRK